MPTVEHMDIEQRRQLLKEFTKMDDKVVGKAKKKNHEQETDKGNLTKSQR